MIVVQTVLLAGAPLIVVAAGLAAVLNYRRAGGRDGVYRALKVELEERLEARKAIPLVAFGDIEKDIPDLKEVVIVAHRVEDPSDSLRAAVQDNFQEGVRYIFAVSSTQFESSRQAYVDFFRAIYTIAQACAPKAGTNAAIHQKSFESLFAVLPLRGEWGTWPYVFYRYNGAGDTPLKIVGFRGDQIREGIAENYYELSAADSQSIYTACQMSLVDNIIAKEGHGNVEFENADTVANIAHFRK